MQSEHPAELARLWRAAGPSRLGRRPELDTERVVRSAVELADRDGVDAVTLARLAGSLGVTTMALYRHIGSKDELLGLMQDLAVGEPPEIKDAGDFLSGLREWATAFRRVYDDHPWLAGVTLASPPLGPYSVAWMNLALVLLRPTGLDWGEKLAVLGMLSGYVRQSAQLAIGFAQSGAGTPEAEAAYGRSLAQLIDPQTYPEVAQLVASGALGAPPAEGDPDEFTYGLTIILHGIAHPPAHERAVPK
ncbi:AcrR family transcriptional regulator [Kribbella aluminosa]|uniref:AcrR family transcriptional regulator n=1 Tax=Kribbella aluminosa TaxID=416017 RepID=A0ABS4UW77_9ACTN|nr:TetR/AcrR family transcriptional regulator [Kribbella aluminosa]MBP2355904.1 AcrR family transcriptional regulator [Kribbella aluminosa]